jgi:chromosome segregation ATPase
MDLPQGWFTQLVTMIGSAGGTALLMRHTVSKQRVAIAGDSADVHSIKRLLDQLDSSEKRRKEAEERADKFADERNEMFRQMGEMRAEMAELKAEVRHLTNEVNRLQGEP